MAGDRDGGLLGMRGTLSCDKSRPHEPSETEHHRLIIGFECPDMEKPDQLVGLGPAMLPRGSDDICRRQVRYLVGEGGRDC